MTRHRMPYQHSERTRRDRHDRPRWVKRVAVALGLMTIGGMGLAILAAVLGGA